jgi:hypothetical protein
MRFRSAEDGLITALRHWRSPSETGTHVGRIWDAQGTQLAAVTFQNESGSGWQEQALATPLAIQSNTDYVVSVNINGFFPISYDVFDTPVVNGDLTGVANGNNGVFGTPGSFPTSSYRNSNYFRDVVFVAGGVPTLSVVSGDNQSGAAGTALAQPLVVALNDSGGNPVVGETVSFTVTGGGGSVSAASVVTGASGQASTVLTLGSSVGANTVQASAPLAGNVSFTATATAGAPASVVVVSGDGQTGTVGQALANPLVAEARDGNGNAVAGATVTFAVTAGGGVVSPTSVTTAANGRASTVLTLGTAPGTNTVSASVAGAGSVSFNATGVLDPGSAASIEMVSGDGQSAAVGTALSPFVVLVRDDSGNPLPGVSVGFALTAGGGSLSTASAVTDSGGEASTVLTLPTIPGSSTVSATAGAAGSVPFTATATAGAPAALVLTPASANGAIGTPVAYQATIEDQFGNVVTSAGGTVNFTASGIAGSFSPGASVAPVAGVASVDFTPGAGGSGTITAAYAGVSNASASIQVVVGSLSILSGDGQWGAVGSPLAAPFVVEVLNGAGNPVSGVTVTFALTEGGGSLSASTDVTASNGQASTVLTLSQAKGPRIVQASATGYGAVQFTASGYATSNAITIENQNQGSTGWKMTNPVSQSNPEIMGYAGATSVNRGDAIDFKISLAQVGSYTIDVYRLGYYAGTGGRLMQSSGTQGGTAQPACLITDTATRLVECSWSTSYTLQVGSNWTSGFYVAKLTRSGSGRQSQIWFVVRDDSGNADVLFQSSFTTFLAYNHFGSVDRHSLYGFNSTGGQRALKVSFDRPLGQVTTDQGRYDNVFDYEHSMIRWMESQGYDISYVTNVDVHENPNQLSNHRVFLSVGHDEYWSEEMRNAVEQALDDGVNLGFFSANTAFWRVRFESASSGGANRVMVCYKDPLAVDPIAPTYLWRGPENSRPENALLGVMYTGDNSFDRYGGAGFVIANSADSYFAHTGLQNGDILPGLVGFEWDSLVPNGQTPPGLVVLGESPVQPTLIAPELPPGTDTSVSHAVRYTAGSGGKVFSTGSIQFMWVLDHSVVPGWAQPKTDARGKQFVINILLDMGARPATPDAQVVLP